MRKDLNPEPGKPLRCALCHARIPVELTVPYNPFEVKEPWSKSVFTVEFVSNRSEYHKENPYMDLCESCFDKITTKMRVLKYFKEMVADDKTLRNLVTGREDKKKGVR